LIKLFDRNSFEDGRHLVH